MNNQIVTFKHEGIEFYPVFDMSNGVTSISGYVIISKLKTYPERFLDARHILQCPNMYQRNKNFLCTYANNPNIVHAMDRLDLSVNTRGRYIEDTHLRSEWMLLPLHLLYERYPSLIKYNEKTESYKFVGSLDQWVDIHQYKSNFSHVKTELTSIKIDECKNDFEARRAQMKVETKKLISYISKYSASVGCDLYLAQSVGHYIKHSKNQNKIEATFASGAVWCIFDIFNHICGIAMYGDLPMFVSPDYVEGFNYVGFGNLRLNDLTISADPVIINFK